MKNCKWNPKWERLIVYGSVAVLMALLALWQRPVFYLNDDATMRSILSGAYTGTPDGHAVYMGYPLTGILSLLYRLSGNIPWLELFFAGCILCTMAEVIGSAKNKIVGIGISAVLFLSLYLYMHYTLIAAALVGTAVYIVCTRESRIKPVVFFLLAYMVRSQVALLGIPFMGVALLWKLINADKAERIAECKKLGILCAAALAGLFICAGIHAFCYRSEGWQEFLEYNEHRTTLMDYTDFFSTDVYAQTYEQYGMTREEFAVLNSYNTMLDGTFDAEKMELVAQKVSAGMRENRDEAEWLKECVKQYYYQIRYGQSPYVFLWLGGFALLAGLLIIKRNWWSLGLLGCLGAGRSLIWVYLIWKGRFPERVSLSLYMIELLLLAGMIFSAWEKCAGNVADGQEPKNGAADAKNSGACGKRVICRRVCAALWTVFFAGVLVIRLQNTIPQVTAQTKVQKEWNVLKAYCAENPDKLYLVDVYSAVEYSGMQYEKDAENVMLMGGWTTASPLVAEKFAAFEAADAGEALYYGEAVSFVAEKDADVSWLEEYLESRFGACELKKVADITCGADKIFTEYRVEPSQIELD